MIVEGVLVAGEKVPERALCEKLRVSRALMSEALPVLAADGLLTLEANKGAGVRAITIAELEEVFPLMCAFEDLASELACKNISDDHLNDIAHSHGAMLECFHARDMPGYIAQYQRNCESTMLAAANPMLTSLYRSLAVHVRQA